MADIPAADVKHLRDLTGAGLMACKQALVDADGDMDRAADLVRERTGARMDRKAAERVATDGLVHSYLHAPAPGLPPKIGVLVQLGCETDFVAKNEEVRTLANNVAMHIAAMAPRFLSREEVDADTLEREREFVRKQAEADGKPKDIIDRIVEGKLERFYEETVLLEQPYVRDDDRTVADLVSEVQARVGEKLTVVRFARFEV